MVTTLEPGDPGSVGRYRLVGVLGDRAIGRAYVGLAPDGQVAAVTRAYPRLATDPGFRERYRRETRAARGLSGTHTAAVLEADADADVLWSASVLIPGADLREAVGRCGPLPPPLVRLLAARLAAALAELHGAGLVARAMEPANVVLADDGPRLIDVGLARDTGAADQTAARIGSLAYLSPEHATGRPGPASDVFSLGSVLVFAATGSAPFGTEPGEDVLHQFANGTPRLDNLPPELRSIVQPCLDPNPELRPTPAGVVELVGPVNDLRVSWPPAPVSELVAAHRDELDRLLWSVRANDRGYAGQPPNPVPGWGQAPPAFGASPPAAPGGPPAPVGPAGPWPHPAAPHSQPQPARSPSGRTPWIIAAAIAAVVIVAGVVLAAVLLRPGTSSATSAAPPPMDPAVVAANYGGMPTRCQSVPVTALRQLQTTHPTAPTGTIGDTANCYWDNSTLDTLQVTIEDNNQYAKDSLDRQKEFEEGRITPDSVGDSSVLIVDPLGTLGTWVKVDGYRGSTYVQVEYFLAGSASSQAAPALSPQAAADQVRSIAGGLLTG